MSREEVLARLAARARELEFIQSSDDVVCRLMRVLVALKPDGRYPELGTGGGSRRILWLPPPGR